MLIRGAEVDGRRTDVRLTGARIGEVAPGLSRAPGEGVLDAAGGAVLPGLRDAHLHLHALAAAESSVRCGPPLVRDAADLGAALAAARADETGWVRGVGYVESVAGDLDSAALDRLHAGRPVRLQHRSGALWIVNGLAADRLGLATADAPGIERGADGVPTGRLWREDDWLRTRLPPAPPPDLSSTGARLIRLGITSVTDATPDLTAGALDALAEAVGTGAFPQRLQVLGTPLGGVTAQGLVSGPYKIVLADSGLPALDDLVDRIRAAHATSRAVAVHCVTREALVLLLVALRTAGVVRGDRVEHAALVPAELVGELAALGLRVVTQPGFLADRGDDYLRDVPPADQGDLYRCGSLLRAGVPVSLSSDAPYGPLDPWVVISAAVDRRTRSGAVVGPAERISAAQALAGYLGGRRVAPGAPADLLILDRPLAEQLAAPSAGAVRTVLIGGVPIGGVQASP